MQDTLGLSVRAPSGSSTAYVLTFGGLMPLGGKVGWLGARPRASRTRLQRPCVMSGSSQTDPEGGQGSVGVAAVVTQRGGEVARPGAAEYADSQVAQGRHDLGRRPGPELGGVFCEGGIADVMQRLDPAVAAQIVGQPAGLAFAWVWLVTAHETH
jgi:hypothetical protein